MNNPDITGFDELSLAFGEPRNVGAPIFGRLLELVDALVKQSFPQWLAAGDLARAMGLPNPDQAQTQDLLTRIKEWRNGGSQPTTLSAQPRRTPSDPKFNRSAPGPYGTAGLETSALAQALGLDASTPKAAVLAEITRLAKELWPGHEESAELNRRMALLGLSANATTGRVELVARPRHAFDGVAPEYSLRGQLAQALIKPTDNYAESKSGWAASQTLTASELITLAVQIVATKRAGQGLVLLRAAPNAGNPAGSLHRLDSGATRGNFHATLQAGEPPTRLKLFGWGVNDSTQGRFIVNENTLATLPANQRARGYETVALDYEHNTVPGSPEYERSAEPRPVAAFGNIEVERGKGIFLSAVDWRNPEARHQYQDLSPTVGVNDAGEVTFVHSVALCRNGSVFDLTLRNAVALAAIMPAGSRVGLSPRFSILSATT